MKKKKIFLTFFSYIFNKNGNKTVLNWYINRTYKLITTKGVILFSGEIIVKNCVIHTYAFATTKRLNSQVTFPFNRGDIHDLPPTITT